MAAKFRIERVNVLPVTLTPSTMYIVKAADAANAELYFSNDDGSLERHVINKAEIESLIATQVSAFNNIVVVADIAGRDALTLVRNTLVLVLDATGDNTVEAGAAMYFYDFANTAFVKVAEYESLDVSLEWSNINGRPTSSVAAIDAAVAASHSHSNLTTLNKLAEDQGQLTFDGEPVGAVVSVSEW